MSSSNETGTSSVPTIFNDLMSKRTVVISGKIVKDNIDDVIRRLIALQTLSHEPIYLIIDSSGGSIHFALRLCDLMTTLITAPIKGVAMGLCGSAATFIMLHCDERIGTPYSKFLIHSGYRDQISIPIDQSTADNLELLLKETKNLEEEAIDLYMRKLTPHTWSDNTSNENKRTYVKELIKRGDQNFNNWMSAKEAEEVGLINNIIVDKLDIFKPS